MLLLNNKMNIWKFTHFISDRYLFHERWERDNPNLKEELMMINCCFDPLMGIERMVKSTHYGSRNAWYHYKKTRTKKKKLKENLSDSLIRMSGKEPKPTKGKITDHPPVVDMIEVWPSGENMDKPYVKPHYVFECF